MTAGQLIDVRAERIPSELTQRQQWLVWEPEINPRGKIDKIPYNAANGRRASSTDPSTWTDFDTALDTYYNNPDRWGGIGYVLSDDDGIVGIDLDDCRDPDTGKTTSPDATKIIKAIRSYTETSPSGTGVKILVRASIDRARIDRSRNVEIYKSGRFFTITGHRLNGVPKSVREAQDQIDALIDSFPQRSPQELKYEGYTAQRVPTEWIVQKASRAVNGEKFRSLWSGEWEGQYPSQSEADAALCSMLSFWTGPDRAWISEVFAESGLYREKWDREDYQRDTINMAIEGLDDWYEWYPLTANMNGASHTNAGISLDDFVAYMPKHDYIFIPSREHWPATSINARLKPVQVGLDDEGEPIMVKANLWLDQNRPVEQMTWAPGEPQIIENKLMSQGGWIRRVGVRAFNLYRPPSLRKGDGSQAGKWIEHIKRVYPDDWKHLILWMAHRVQRPDQKLNHAIVLGGPQGIGKDTILEPLKHCVGSWNFSEISPGNVLERFNNFAKSVVLRISEARDLGETDRYKFYEHLKVYTASPPDVLRVNEKFVDGYYVLNATGVIITTNHMEGGLFLPADDRRHYVAWSDARARDFEYGYWDDIWQWYETVGYSNVMAYLSELDLSGFDPKAPPPKTAAFWNIVSASAAPEDAELSDVLDKLGWPDVVTVEDLKSRADWSLESYLSDRRNSRKIPHRLYEAGYVRVRNEDAKDGLWRTHGKRQVVYAKMDLSESERLRIVRNMVSGY